MSVMNVTADAVIGNVSQTKALAIASLVDITGMIIYFKTVNSVLGFA